MPKQIGDLILYDVADLSKALGISDQTVRMYLREGRIKGRKIGTKWHASEEAIKEYFHGGLNENQEQK